MPLQLGGVFFLVFYLNLGLIDNDINLVFEVFMKKYTSPYEILNSFPNNRPYATEEKEQEVKEAIHIKYGIYPHPCKYTLIHSYTEEVKNLGLNLSENVTKTLKECVSAKTGRDPKQWTGADWDYRGKITEKEGIYDKINMLRENLDTYEKQINTYTRQIADSTDMNTADQIASQITLYHDSNIGNLFARSDEVLYDFEVEAMGVPFDVH